MEILSRSITVSLDMQDCETILSWYKSEQEKLLKWEVSEEWKKLQTATTVFKKMQDNYGLIYQISKVPRYWELVPIKQSDVIWELEKIYWK